MIPVVINNRNRVTTLKSLVASLPETKIIILDNASTYPPLLQYYETLPSNVSVVKLNRNIGHMALLEWGRFRDFSERYFVYTDSDIQLHEDCPKDCLEYLVKVKEKYPTYMKVGLSLKIDDLPDHYAFKKEVLNWESKWWQNSFVDNELGRLWIAQIDTTFALYDKQQVINSTFNCLRTDAPYIARHMPWYVNSKKLDAEEKYYTKHSNAVFNNQPVGMWTEKQKQYQATKGFLL